MADFSDHIQLEINTKKAIKSDFICYLNHLYQDEKPAIFGVNYTLTNDVISRTISLMVKARDHLKQTVGVFPVFVEYAFIHPKLKRLAISKKTCDTPLAQIDKNKALKWFLESIYDNEKTWVNNPLRHCQQWIIPIVIGDHITLAVVKVDKANKNATIQYYDSLGYDLSKNYRQQLVQFFEHLGFNVKYHCVSRHEQKDDYNCGIFVILKALDIACHNSGHPEKLLTKLPQDKYHYLQWFNKARYQIGKLLEDNGINVLISAKLKEEQEKAGMISF